MSVLMETMVANAVLATILALLIYAVTRFVKRPPVVYWLWVLVLLKLVTPPVLHLPLKLDFWKQNNDAIRVTPKEDVSPSTKLAFVLPIDTAETEMDHSAANVSGVATTTPVLPLGEPHEELFTTESIVVSAAARRDHEAGKIREIPRRWSWSQTLGLSWLLGSGLWFVLAAIRIYRFDRLIRRALPASEWLQQEAGALANRFRLRRCPQVLIVQGRVPPLLWSVYRQPVVAFPAELLGRLEQVMVIAHELAHCRRRDHWFRWVEVLILGLYWWHPVAWWARRELQEAEEQCCDAWVSWAFPEQIKSYARALLSTIEFLSASRSALPVGASGLGSANDVKRRFTMILQNRSVRRVSLPACIGLILFGGIALSISARVIQADVQETVPENAQVARQDISIETDSTSKGVVLSDASGSSPSINEQVLQALMAATKDEDADVRRGVLFSLAPMANRSSLSVQRQILHALIEATKDEDAKVRILVVRALGGLAHNGFPEAISAMMDVLAESNDAVTCSVSIKALENVAKPTDKMVERLIRLLDADASEFVVSKRPKAVSARKSARKSARDDTYEGRHSSDIQEMTDNARTTLVKWGGYSPNVVTALIEVVNKEKAGSLGELHLAEHQTHHG